jgi:hypothetical protein
MKFGREVGQPPTQPPQPRQPRQAGTPIIAESAVTIGGVAVRGGLGSSAMERARDGKFADLPLEGAGFEPSVPAKVSSVHPPRPTRPASPS